jgi:hypothetical protein
MLISNNCASPSGRTHPAVVAWHSTEPSGGPYGNEQLNPEFLFACGSADVNLIRGCQKTCSILGAWSGYRPRVSNRPISCCLVRSSVPRIYLCFESVLRSSASNTQWPLEAAMLVFRGRLQKLTRVRHISGSSGSFENLLINAPRAGATRASYSPSAPSSPTSCRLAIKVYG